MKDRPPINEMIAFIEQEQPGVINDLREKYPAFSDILKPGVTLGDAAKPGELEVRANVCLTALEAVLSKCNKEIPAIRSKLVLLKKIQLWGQIFTSVGGATVITTVVTKQSTTLTLVAGIISLAGSLIPLVVDFNRSGVVNNKKLDDIYAELCKKQIESEFNLKELKLYTENGFNEAGIADVISKSNQLCMDIRTNLAIKY